MISISESISGKPRQATLEAVRQLLAENHVDDIILDVKQNGNRDRKKKLPVWLPLAASFKNGTRKAEDAVPSGLFFLDIDEKGLTETLWNKVRAENLIEEERIVYFAESAGGGTTSGLGAHQVPPLRRTFSGWQLDWASATTRTSQTCRAAVSW